MGYPYRQNYETYPQALCNDTSQNYDSRIRTLDLVCKFRMKTQSTKKSSMHLL